MDLLLIHQPATKLTAAYEPLQQTMRCIKLFKKLPCKLPHYVGSQSSNDTLFFVLKLLHDRAVEDQRRSTNARVNSVCVVGMELTNCTENEDANSSYTVEINRWT